jgi:ABC-type Co2+ transport system permease subunit
MLASGACAIEIGLSKTIIMQEITGEMLRTHFVIGLAEAFLTVMLVNLWRNMIKAEERSK